MFIIERSLRSFPATIRITRTVVAFLAATLCLTAQQAARRQKFTPGALIVSRVQYEGNTFGEPTGFPDIFGLKTVSGVQGSIHLDEFYPIPGFPRVKTLKLRGVTSNFAGRLEGGLMLSVDGRYLTYIGEASPVGSNGTSTSYNTGPGVDVQGDTNPLYERVVALVAADGTVTLNPVNNAYSGDVPRAVITVDD